MLSRMSLLTRRSSLPIRRAFSSNVYGGAAASPAAKATFEAWHSSVNAVLHEGMDSEPAMAILQPHMHEQCVFRPPTYFTPWTGRAETLLLLGAVSEVFGPSFKYGREWLSDDGLEWALEFTASVGDSGKEVHGIDLVSLSSSSSPLISSSLLLSA